MKLTKRFENLLEKDFHITEKRKLIFGIPIAILVVAIVLMIVFNFTLGAPLNLSTDFTGGYSVDVKLSNKLTEENRETYYKQIESVLRTVTDENGKTYNISISGAMQSQGIGTDDSSIHVRYSAVSGVSESEMSNLVNPAIISALESGVLGKIPTVAIDGKTITLTYGEVINAQNEGNPFDVLRAQFTKLIPTLNEKYNCGISATESDITLDAQSGNKQIVINCASDVVSSAELESALVDGMKLPDKYYGSVVGGELVGATVSSELLFKAMLAISLALVFMLCYIGLRFQLSSGLACIIALFHDIIIVFAAMAIFHIEINNTFIAAIITILGYSINNSIILFDRVRERMRLASSKKLTPEAVANASIKDTLLRSINTTITTLIMILMVAIIGVTDIRIFAFPIIIGLLAGTFSSICIAPSLWALFQRVGKNRENFALAPKNKPEKPAKATELSA